MSLTPEELARNLMEAASKVANPQELMRGLAPIAERSVKAAAPVRSGKLRRSINTRVEQKRVVVGTDVSYAAAVHEGTRAHVIRPSSKSVLRFETARGIVFAKEVRHPGTKARPFMTEGLRRAESEIERGMQGYGDDLLKVVAG